MKDDNKIEFLLELVTSLDLDDGALIDLFGQMTNAVRMKREDEIEVPNNVVAMITTGTARELHKLIMDRGSAAHMSRRTVKALLQKHKYGHDLSMRYYDKRLSDVEYPKLVSLFIHLFYDMDMALDDIVEIENTREIPVIR